MIKDVKNRKIIFVLAALIIILTGCSDLKSPRLILNTDVEINYASHITENKLLELLVDTVSDERSNTDEIKLSIENFKDDISSLVGEHEIVVKAVDPSGNETTLATMINVNEPSKVSVEEAQEIYREQLVNMSSTGLFSDETIKQYQLLNERLTIENYEQFGAVLNQYQEMKYEELNDGNDLIETEINQKLRELEDSGFFVEQFIEPMIDLQDEARDIYAAQDVRESLKEVLERINLIF